MKPLALSPTIPAPLNTWLNGRSYPELFQEAFGTPDVTPARIALAIATFERSLYSDRAPVDLDAQGIAALTPQEARGRNIFASPANNCAVCHGGSLVYGQRVPLHRCASRTRTIPAGSRSPGCPQRPRNFSYAEPEKCRAYAVRFFITDGSRRSSRSSLSTTGAVILTANNKPNLIHPLGLNAAAAGRPRRISETAADRPAGCVGE